jgi:hypothetical protein
MGVLCAALAVAAFAAFAIASGPVTAFAQASAPAGRHEGVATCFGSNCHTRQVALEAPAHVRQNEVITWQDRSSKAGAHSRAYSALTGARGQAIIQRTASGKIDDCLGCHTDMAPAGRGPRHRIDDGVGCEACHGGASNWLESHRTVTGDRRADPRGITESQASRLRHAANLRAGMTRLEDPRTRANVCLDCHFGSSRRNQFVTHEMMAAGHPRVAFELDLFSSLQKHWDVDRDYLDRKASTGHANGVKTWAVGQAMALNRTLTLYPGPARGVFPEFYFFDCHSCHRPISDDPKARLTAEANPGRPVPRGTAPFNDENIIMLSAAAKVAAPQLSGELTANSRAFHAALASDRAQAQRAAANLAATTGKLADAFARHDFSRDETLRMLDAVLTGEIAARYTDYAGSAQAVMAADTLLNHLVASGGADRADVARIRPSLDRAYAQVRDPDSYRPEAFRASLAQVAQAARSLR